MRRFIPFVFLIVLVGAGWVLPLAAQENPTLLEFMTQQAIEVNTLTLADGTPFDPVQSNCAVNGFGFRIDGQVYLISGSGSGLVVDPHTQDEPPSTAGVDAENLLAGSNLKDLMPSTLLGASSGNGPVALLVVDDFSSNPSLSGLFAVGTAPDPAAAISAALAVSPIPHGALVYNFVNEILTQAGYSLTSGNELSALWKSPGGGNFLVMAVDTNGYTTQDIAPAMTSGIADAIAQLDVLEPGVHPAIVVNMSFGVLGCTVVDDVKNNGSTNIQDYLLTFSASDNNLSLLSQYMAASGSNLTELEIQDRLTQLRNARNSSLQDYITLIQSDANYQLIAQFHEGLIQLLVGSGDPLLGQIQEMKNNCTLFVASAGNDGLPFSYYPGLWPEVLSVAATEQGQTLRAPWSNAGETIDKGAWYALTDPLNLYNGGNPVGVYFKGTSFSAPMVSVLAGMKASVNPSCADNAVISGSFDGLTSGFDDTPSTDALNQIFP